MEYIIRIFFYFLLFVIPIFGLAWYYDGYHKYQNKYIIYIGFLRFIFANYGKEFSFKVPLRKCKRIPKYRNSISPFSLIIETITFILLIAYILYLVYTLEYEYNLRVLGILFIVINIGIIIGLIIYLAILDTTIKKNKPYNNLK